MAACDLEAEPIVTRDAAVRAAEKTVANALSTDFSIDPLVGAELSRPVSVINSVVQRHGLLIPRAIGDVLLNSGRFDVFTEMRIDIPAAADDLIRSRNSRRDLAKIRLRADARPARTVTVDLCVVDRESGWAGAYDCKRGHGATESRRRQIVEHDLIAIRLVLASHLARSGFDIIRVTTAVIDYFGCSGFSDDIKVFRHELDKHFGVPVTDSIDQMTAALKQELRARLRSLIEPALHSLPLDVVTPLPDATIAHPNVTALFGRPEGPGPWRVRERRSSVGGSRSLADRPNDPPRTD
jgi:hypothetical protein